MKQQNKPRGGPYPRAGSQYLWIAYYDAGNRRRLVSAETASPELAEKRWLALDKAARLEERLATGDEGPLTVRRYAKRWLKGRRERNIASVDEDEDRLRHVPGLMAMRLDLVKRSDVKKAIADLMHAPADLRLAPRTIRHVYGALRVMFSDALAEELIAATPCTLKQRMRELPKKQDKNPLWRKSARFARHEVEMLISDARIAEPRRVLYALMLLAGPRINEIAPRRWRDYDPDAKPLGSLSVHSSYSVRKREEKSTKTEEPREVPVHPVLAKVLAGWKAAGWARYRGRLPRPDDLIIPGARGGVMNSNYTYELLQADLELLGMRRRRQHDTRRTFISLAIADGARKDLLRWVTHGPEGDQMDDYTTPPWEALCREVSCLRIRLPEGEGRVLPLPTATALLQDG
jgi:hypothetical protein